jgi:predicted acyltransferase (DUF342 family)
LYVEDDVSFNNKLYVHHNVTLNRNVDISGVTRIDDKLYVEDDVSFNNKLYVHNDASFNARVDISGATRIDDKLYVEDDVSFNNKLYVHNDASFNARVDISGATRIDDKLYVEDDVSFNNKLYVHNDVSFNEKLFVKSSSRFKDYVMFEDTIQVSKNSTFEDKVLINTENNYNESNGGLHNYGEFNKATLLLEHTNSDHGASSIVFQNNVINNTEQHYGTLSYLDNFLDSYNPHSINYSNIVRANDISHNGLFLSATNDNDVSNNYMSHIVIRPTGHLILDTGISAETHENRSGNNPPGHILMMPNGGKVGIGTLDPSYNLDVRYITKTESNQNIFGDDNSGNSFTLNTHTWNELSASDIHDTDANRKQLQFVTTQTDNLTSVDVNEEWECFETKHQYNVRDPTHGSINTTYFGNHGLHTTIGNSLGEIIRIDEFGHVCIGKDAYKRTKGSGNILLNQDDNATLEISGNIYVTNDVIVGNDQRFKGNQITEGTTDLCGAVHMYDILEVDKDASFNSNVVVVGTTDLCGAVHMYDTLQVDGDASFNSNMTVGSYAKFSENGVEFGPTRSSVVIGYQAGDSTKPIQNVTIGYQAGLNTTSINNVIIGYNALKNSTYSDTNFGGEVAIGMSALANATTGGANTGVGHNALLGVTTGRGNVALGFRAGHKDTNGIKKEVTTGIYNTFLGLGAHTDVSDCANSTAIGFDSTITKSNQIVLGKSSTPPDVYIPGNLGIGTTSPAHDLDVTGTMRVTSHLTCGGDFNMSGGNNTISCGNLIAINANTTLFRNATGGEIMTITGGKVGIGTTSPTYTLDVSGNMRVESATDLCGAVHMYDTLEVDKDASFNSNVVVVGTTDLCGAVHMYDTLEVDKDASFNSNVVVVGTTDLCGAVHMYDTLEVDKDASFNSNVVVVGTTDLCGTVHMYDTLEVDKDASFNSNVVVVGTTDLCGTVHMYDKLGIGTTSPTTALTIRKKIDYGTSTADDLYGLQASMIEFKSYHGGVIDHSESVKSAIYSGVSEILPKNSNAGFMAFHVRDGDNTDTDGTMYERLRIEKNGNVGIGITKPVSCLDVRKDITLTNDIKHLQSQFSIGNATLESGYVGMTYRARGIYVGDVDADLTSGIVYAATYCSSGTGNFGTETLYFGIAVTDVAQDGEKYGVTDNELTSLTHLAITNLGKVGIGTTNPYSTCQIFGDTGLTVSPSTSTGVRTAVLRLGQPFDDGRTSDAYCAKITSTNNHDVHYSDLRFHTYDGLWQTDVEGAESSRIGDDSEGVEPSTVERMRITKDGNVGIGTKSPSYTLDVSGNINCSGNITVTSSPATSDDSKKVATTAWVKDQGYTTGSNLLSTSGGTITGELNIESNTSTGTTHAQKVLRLERGTNQEIFFGINLGNDNYNDRTNTNDHGMFWQNSGTSNATDNNFIISPWGMESKGITIYGAGGVASTSFNADSDYRLKENVQTISGELYTVDNLRPVSYVLKESQEPHIGFIAHELQEHVPTAVKGEKDGEVMQSVNYSELIPILVKEIQDLKQEVRSLKQQVHELSH